MTTSGQNFWNCLADAAAGCEHDEDKIKAVQAVLGNGSFAINDQHVGGIEKFCRSVESDRTRNELLKIVVSYLEKDLFCLNIFGIMALYTDDMARIEAAEILATKLHKDSQATDLRHILQSEELRCRKTKETVTNGDGSLMTLDVTGVCEEEYGISYYGCVSFATATGDTQITWWNKAMCTIQPPVAFREVLYPRPGARLLIDGHSFADANGGSVSLSSGRTIIASSHVLHVDGEGMPVTRESCGLPLCETRLANR